MNPFESVPPRGSDKPTSMRRGDGAKRALNVGGYRQSVLRQPPHFRKGDSDTISDPVKLQQKFVDNYARRMLEDSVYQRKMVRP